MQQFGEYNVCRIDETRYADLVYISKSAFNINPGIEYFRLKNNTTSFGESNLGFIAYHRDGEPAAFYGIYACKVEYKGVIYSAAQSGDTMTHRSHTGKGLFTFLAKNTYELAKEHGIHLVFGSPNENSYPGFVKKLDWICPYRLNEYRKKVLTLPLAKLFKKLSFIKFFYKAYSSIILSFYRSKKEVIPNSVVSDDAAGVSRDKAYFDYKKKWGSKIIEIDGVAVWLKIDGFLFIGDIEKNNSIDYLKVIRKIMRMARWLGCDVILFQCSPGTFLDQQFARIIPPKEAFYFGCVNFSSPFPTEKLKIVFGDIDTF